MKKQKQKFRYSPNWNHTLPLIISDLAWMSGELNKKGCTKKEIANRMRWLLWLSIQNGVSEEEIADLVASDGVYLVPEFFENLDRQFKYATYQKPLEKKARKVGPIS